MVPLDSYQSSVVKETQGLFYSAGKGNFINRLLAMNDQSTFQASMVPACPG